MESIIKKLINRYDDVNREGLKETPKRFLKFYDEFLKPPEFKFTTFKSEGYTEMIVVNNIVFHSLCEHHLAPFFGYAKICYIPDKKIAGISKLPRTLDYISRRLQNQERITNEVAQYIYEKLKPKGVAVSLEAEHLCMSMRGIKKPGSKTITNSYLGIFQDNEKLKQEYQTIKIHD